MRLPFLRRGKNKPTPTTGRWAGWQIERLATEHSILTKTFPGFVFIDPSTTTARVRGDWVSHANRRYTIEIQLSAGYPDEAPQVYIVDPFPLLGHGEVPMHSHGTSHAMHTFASLRDTVTRLCTVRPEAWDARWTIAKIIQKAQLWLMAYEFHCDTGEPVDAFLLN